MRRYERVASKINGHPVGRHVEGFYEGQRGFGERVWRAGVLCIPVWIVVYILIAATSMVG